MAGFHTGMMNRGGGNCDHTPIPVQYTTKLVLNLNLIGGGKLLLGGGISPPPCMKPCMGKRSIYRQQCTITQSTELQYTLRRRKWIFINNLLAQELPPGLDSLCQHSPHDIYSCPNRDTLLYRRLQRRRRCSLRMCIELKTFRYYYETIARPNQSLYLLDQHF